MVSLEPTGSQLPLAQNNAHAKVANFGKACSEPLQAEQGEFRGIVAGDEVKDVIAAKLCRALKLIAGVADILLSEARSH